MLIDVIYPEELETTTTPKWANYLDLRLELDDGKRYTRIYHRRADFDSL